MNKYITLAASAAVAFSAGAASAATTLYDFQVTQFDEQAVEDGTDISGIASVTAPASVLVAGFGFDGTDVLAGAGEFAYLDGDSNTKPGGLGVCSDFGVDNRFPTSAPGQACIPSSDDNIDEDEALAVSFGADAIFGEIFLRDGGHNALNGTFKYALGQGENFQVGTAVNGIFDFGDTVVGNGILWLAVDDKGIYLSKAYVDGGGNNNVPPSVPLPAGGLLLATGLAGLGIARRRRK